MAQSPEETPESFSAICPFLHSREDPTTAYAYPAVKNRCYAPQGPKKLAGHYQVAFCLGPDYERCRFYLAQEMLRHGVSWPSGAGLAAQPAHAVMEPEPGSINLAGADVPGTRGDWRDRLAGSSRVIRLALQASLITVGPRLESAQASVVAVGVTSLLVAVLATIALFGGAAYLIQESGRTAPTSKVSSAGSISTPSTPLTASSLPSGSPKTIVGLNLVGTPSATIAQGPTATPSGISTQAATSIPLDSPTESPSSTPLPTATDTPSPNSTVTSTHMLASVKVSTATFTPAPGTSPSSDQTYPAPILLEPLDGMGLQKKTILRWSSVHQLNPDEVFEIFIWHESMPQPVGLSTTTEQQEHVDFRLWIYPQYSGRFLWMIRIKRVGGGYLSPGGQPFSFIVNESGLSVPPAAPPPTSKPPPPPPSKPTRQPTPPPP